MFFHAFPFPKDLETWSGTLPPTSSDCFGSPKAEIIFHGLFGEDQMSSSLKTMHLFFFFFFLERYMKKYREI